MLVPYDDSNDDEVQEVSAPSGYACKEKKTRIRVPWSEARLLCLLQTAANHHYSTIRFNGENLSRGDKVKTMKVIREALGHEPDL